MITYRVQVKVSYLVQVDVDEDAPTPAAEIAKDAIAIARLDRAGADEYEVVSTEIAEGNQ